MLKHSHNHHRTAAGFTLLELAVVLTILGLLVPALFAMFFANIRAQSKILVLQRVKQNGDAALDVMETLIKVKAQSIEQSDGSPVCATGDSTYSGDLYFVDGDGERFMFHEDGGQIASESATTTVLTADAVVVSAFEMSCERESLFTPPLISIMYTVEQAGSSTRIEETASLTYQTKIRLRNL